MGATKRLHAWLRHAEVLNLTLRDQFLNSPRNVLNRQVRIDSVLIEKVDAFDSKSLERSLNGALDPARPAADATIFTGLEVDVEAELGGNDYAIPERTQRLAYNLFVDEGAVNLGSIEEGHTAFDRGADQGDALDLGQFCRVAEADTHAAKPDG
jgi:hypothetical protein